MGILMQAEEKEKEYLYEFTADRTIILAKGSACHQT
jgi:hypothetical protein